MGDIMRMVKDIYVVPASRVEPARRRFLIMQLLLFFGMKRFSDIIGLRKKDVAFMKDGSVEIWMRKSKTDLMARGAKFFLSGKKSGGVCLPEMLKWYLTGFEMKEEDVLLPRLRHSRDGVVAIRGLAVSYGTAAEQL